MQDQAVLAIIRELRDMGATEVSVGGFRVVFDGAKLPDTGFEDFEGLSDTGPTAEDIMYFSSNSQPASR